MRLVVEVDRGYHERLRVLADERSERWLRRKGYVVLHLRAELVMRNVGRAVELIAEQLAALRP